MTGKPLGYAELLNTIKERIHSAQIRAALSVNREMLAVYWDIGRMIEQRQRTEGWGAAVIPRLSRDICNAVSEVKGFSERNLKRMIRFYREYPFLLEKMPQAAAQLPDEKVPQAVAQIQTNSASEFREAILGLPWGHNIVLMEKVKNLSIRLWYMQKAISYGWSRNILILQIENDLYYRQGNAVSNFNKTLPYPQSDLANQTLKDPYIFDFLTIDKEAHERAIEKELVNHITKFLLELGAGFAFVGKQFAIEVSGQDFYIDLLFYHTRLHCYVVVELKTGEFKPEYAGQINFYLSALDDLVRSSEDNPSIGIILCATKNKILAEYALRDMRKPIGVAEWKTKLTRSLPKKMKGSLPTIEEIEAELGKKGNR